MDDQLQLLLTEFRAFRDTEWREFRESVAAWQQDTGERVVRLETVVKPALQGNGRPPQIVSIDTRVTRLEKAWGKVVAVGAAVWAAITIAAHYLPLSRTH